MVLLISYCFFFFAFSLIICIQHDGGCPVVSRWVVCVFCKRTFFAISSNNILLPSLHFIGVTMWLCLHIPESYAIETARSCSGIWLSLIDPRIRADQFIVRFCLLVVTFSISFLLAALVLDSFFNDFKHTLDRSLSINKFD